MLGSPWTEASRGQAGCASTWDSLLAGPRDSGASRLRESLSVGLCALACGCHGRAILLVEQAAAGAEGGWASRGPSSETALGSLPALCTSVSSSLCLDLQPWGFRGVREGTRAPGRRAGMWLGQRKTSRSGEALEHSQAVHHGLQVGRAGAEREPLPEPEPMRSPNNTRRSPLGRPWSLDG